MPKQSCEYVNCPTQFLIITRFLVNLHTELNTSQYHVLYVKAH